MNTSVKIPHHNEDLNPKEQVCCEELINCLLDLLSIRTTVGGIYEVPCPEATGIPQGIPNMGLLMSGEIFTSTEDSVVIQIADILL